MLIFDHADTKEIKEPIYFHILNSRFAAYRRDKSMQFAAARRSRKTFCRRVESHRYGELRT
jgi:hypothetical protein